MISCAWLIPFWKAKLSYHIDSKPVQYPPQVEPLPIHNRRKDEVFEELPGHVNEFLATRYDYTTHDIITILGKKCWVYLFQN